MPRDSADTRARLLLAAEELFAERGIWQVPTAEIVGLAGQRNASALSYHFGSRDQVLEAVLTEHDDPVDARRGELIATIDGDASLTDWVTVLVDAIIASLESERGRRYLRIVDQISHMAFEGSNSAAAIRPNLGRALQGIDDAISPMVPLELRRERIKAMIMLMTASLAERARHVERVANGQTQLRIDARGYQTNLIDMLVGVVAAPVRDLVD